MNAFSICLVSGELSVTAGYGHKVIFQVASLLQMFLRVNSPAFLLFCSVATFDLTRCLCLEIVESWCTF